MGDIPVFFDPNARVHRSPTAAKPQRWEGRSFLLTIAVRNEFQWTGNYGGSFDPNFLIASATIWPPSDFEVVEPDGSHRRPTDPYASQVNLTCDDIGFSGHPANGVYNGVAFLSANRGGYLLFVDGYATAFVWPNSGYFNVVTMANLAIDDNVVWSRTYTATQPPERFTDQHWISLKK